MSSLPGRRRAGIEDFWTVGGGEDEEALGLVDAVQFVKQRCDGVDAGMLAAGLGGTDGVDFVEEDDARTDGAGSGEELPDCSFGLTDVHVQKLGAFDGDEV